MSLVKRCSTPSTSATTERHRATRLVGLEPAYDGVADQVEVVVLHRRPYGDHLGVGLGVHQAREAIARRAADARAGGRFRLVEQDARRRVERMEPDLGQVVEELLDAGLVRDRGMGIRRRRRRLGGILTPGAVHLVELLGLRVVRLEVAVVDGPGRRDPVVVLELAEVALPEPVQGGSVELRRAADEVVDLGLERLAVLVVPAVGRHVPVVDEDRRRIPVLDLARQPVTALQDQDPLAGRCQPVRQGAAACPRPDDDHVVVVVPVVVHGLPLRLRCVASQCWGRVRRRRCAGCRPRGRPTRCASGPCAPRSWPHGRGRSSPMPR